MPYPIARYLNINMAYGPTFSAGGRSLAFLSNITGTAQLWQVDLERVTELPPWPEQLTFAADRVMWAAYAPAPGYSPATGHAPIAERMLVAHDVGGDENAQLFLLARDSDGRLLESPLTAGHEDAMHIPGEWSRDGQSFLFAANRRRADLFDLYLQATDGSGARPIWQNDAPGYLFNPTFSPNGQRVAVSRASASSSHDLFEIDLETGAARQLNQLDKTARYPAIAYSGDGRSLYLNTDLDSDFLHIVRLELESLVTTPVATLAWDVEVMTRSHNGRWLAFVANEDGAGRLYLLDLSTGQMREAPAPDAAPGVAAADNQLVFAPDDDRIAFTYSSSIRTHDVFVWDLAADTVTAVTRSSHGGLPPSSFTVPELIHYPTFDGRKIPAWFFRPHRSHRPEVAPEQGLSALIMVHGGPEAQTRPVFNPIAQYFVNNGYAVLAPNVRGSTGYGKAYSHLDDVEKRMDSVADLAHAVYWLHDNPAVDNGRIAVYGGSYGGFMVLSALTTYANLWAAGVNIVGISNLATFLENTSDYRRAHRESEYGSLENDREFLESIAPINHLDHITAPLMVIHGANDPRVPLSEAEQLVAALKERGVPVEFLVFDDEGHGLAKLKNKLVAYPAVVDFLNNHLPHSPSKGFP